MQQHIADVVEIFVIYTRRIFLRIIWWKNLKLVHICQSYYQTSSGFLSCDSLSRSHCSCLCCLGLFKFVVWTTLHYIQWDVRARQLQQPTKRTVKNTELASYFLVQPHPQCPGKRAIMLSFLLCLCIAKLWKALFSFYSQCSDCKFTCVCFPDISSS